jgi:IgGFc binding protein
MPVSRRGVVLVLAAVALLACAEGQQDAGASSAATTGAGGTGGSGGELTLGGNDCPGPSCSMDGTAVVDCSGNVTEQCGPLESCVAGECKNGCDFAAEQKSSVGCDYYPAYLDLYQQGPSPDCFAVFIANTFPQPAHLEVSQAGQMIDLGQFGFVPVGSGPALTFDAFDPDAGIPPGGVVLLFLVNGFDAFVKCPYPAALQDGAHVEESAGVFDTFHVRSSVPVVGYQMLPYGGGSAAVTGSSLLIPTTAWADNYVLANAYAASAIVQGPDGYPSLNVVAAEDGTEVTILPKAAIVGGGGLAGGPANVPITYSLAAGQVMQLTQAAELTGSPMSANKPVGVFAGQVCMNVPADVYFCDHGEQSIPPVASLGHEYVAVGYRQRGPVVEQYRYRIVGAVDGTALTFEPSLPGVPSSVDLGQVSEFWSEEPFVVKSQDADHPFLFLSYMVGQQAVGAMGFGDADFVRVVPPEQYLSRYVFFTDPTFPETNLVAIRAKKDGAFADVELVCSGTLTDWQPVGTSGDYEFTRIDVSRHDFVGQNGCDNGRNEMRSNAPFGLTVWGWGSLETTIFTINASYGYPAGESIAPINRVIVPPTPK